LDWSNLKLQLFFSFDFPEMSIKLNSRSMILALRNPAKKLSGKVQYYRKSISTFPIKFSKWKSFCFSSERLFLTEERAIVFVHISNVSIWRPLKIVIKKKGKEKNRQEQNRTDTSLYLSGSEPSPEWKWESKVCCYPPRFDVI
jgi:hypothetical protein